MRERASELECQKGTSEEGTERVRDGAREREEGGSERRREGARKGGSKEGYSREGNFKEGTLRRTLASIQYTAHKTTHNAALALETLLFQIKTLNGYNIL